MLEFARKYQAVVATVFGKDSVQTMSNKSWSADQSTSICIQICGSPWLTMHESARANFVAPASIVTAKVASSIALSVQ